MISSAALPKFFYTTIYAFSPDVVRTCPFFTLEQTGGGKYNISVKKITIFPAQNERETGKEGLCDAPL
jgi:hypothetical protein